MAGILYIVGTPIGNLGDVTFRQKETFEKVDFICAEDTRVTVKLLNHLGIKKPLVSYHEHSSRQVSENIIARITSGENCAVVTDAGMPCISDPGEDLVMLCAEQDIRTEVVPGPTAVASAVAISGLITSRFCFEGFLSVTKKQRYEHLQSVAKDTHTLVFYEAPHKLTATLSDMYQYFGDRKISICRELTKIHEEVIRTTLSDAISYYENVTPKGEFVLVVEGYTADEEQAYTIDDAVKEVKKLIDKGQKSVDACKDIAKLTGFKKSELYNLISKE